MATDGTAAAMARDVDRSLTAAAKAIDSATKVALRKAGKVARSELMQRATEGPGADRFYSGLGPNSRLEVRTKYGPTAVVVFPKGHWSIAQRGVKAHGNHPGTVAKQGKQSWTRGRDAAFSVLEDEIPKDIANEVGRAFRG